MSRRLTAISLFLLLLAGCENIWTRIDADTIAYKTDHYAVDLPQDWVRFGSGKSVLVTRDGVGIQRVSLEFHPHDEAFEKTEQKSEPDMPPSELADRHIAELRAREENGMPSLEILQNRPATIGGRLGFELHLRFLNNDGLRLERLVNGFANDDGFFVVSFQAPTLHFFERDRGVYEKLVESFRPI